MKGLSEIRGMEKLRTMHNTKQRSIPRNQRSIEIELYLMERERERYVKEAIRLRKRYEIVEERIRSLDEEIEKHHEARAQQKPPQKKEKKSSKGSKDDWKTKRMMY